MFISPSKSARRLISHSFPLFQKSSNMAQSTASRITGSHRAEVNHNSKTITLHPNPGLHSATCIFLHGLGDTEGWLDGAAFMGKQLPHFKFILPTAPTQPVTLNGGFPCPSWYDITGLGSRASEKCEGLEASRDTINKIISKETNIVDEKNIVIAGFSQGGSLALFTGLSLDFTPAGILVMSSYLSRPGTFDEWATSKGKKSAVQMFHGNIDDVVKLDWAVESHKVLKEHGVPIQEMKVYSGLGHSVSVEELNDAADFLKSRVPN